MSVHEFIIVFIMSEGVTDLMFIDISTAIYALLLSRLLSITKCIGEFNVQRPHKTDARLFRNLWKDNIEYLDSRASINTCGVLDLSLSVIMPRVGRGAAWLG